MGQISPQALLGNGTTANGDGIVGIVRGHKKRKSGEMIPMRMRENQVDVRCGVVFHHREAQLAYTGSRIDDDTLARFRLDFNASGLTAIAKSFLPRRCERPATTPDSNVHDRALVFIDFINFVNASSPRCFVDDDDSEYGINLLFQVPDQLKFRVILVSPPLPFVSNPCFDRLAMFVQYFGQDSN